jgi:hypothetical protein
MTIPFNTNGRRNDSPAWQAGATSEAQPHDSESRCHSLVLAWRPPRPGSARGGLPFRVSTITAAESSCHMAKFVANKPLTNRDSGYLAHVRKSGESVSRCHETFSFFSAE